MTVDYDEQTSPWQDGYGDFYAWWNAPSDMSDDELDAMQFANEPQSVDFNARKEYWDHKNYHAGWNHANFENAYGHDTVNAPEGL